MGIFCQNQNAKLKTVSTFILDGNSHTLRMDHFHSLIILYFGPSHYIFHSVHSHRKSRMILFIFGTFSRWEYVWLYFVFLPFSLWDCPYTYCRVFDSLWDFGTMSESYFYFVVDTISYLYFHLILSHFTFVIHVGTLSE